MATEERDDVRWVTSIVLTFPDLLQEKSIRTPCIKISEPESTALLNLIGTTPKCSQRIVRLRLKRLMEK